jgi:hypothetical protein
MGALGRIFSARHDAHPFRGMYLMGIGWPHCCPNTLSWSESRPENGGGQSKVHTYNAKWDKTIPYFQNWPFPLTISYFVLGILSKILVSYRGISGIIAMAWGVRRRVFVDVAARFVMCET